MEARNRAPEESLTSSSESKLYQEAALAAALALSGAAIAFAGRGRNLTSAIIGGMETKPITGARIEGRLLMEALENRGSLGEIKNLPKSLGAKPTSLDSATTTQPLTARQTEELANLRLNAAAHRHLQSLEIIDSPIRAKARAQAEALERAGLAPRDAEGVKLGANEQFYAAYMDSLPRKTALEFHESGNLLPGLYSMSMREFRLAFAHNDHRRLLAERFEDTLQTLSQRGVNRVHVGGSFVTRKPLPNDIDFLIDGATVKKPLGYGNKDPYLLQQGLHLLTDPPAGGTYKGSQYFLAHGKLNYPYERRGRWLTRTEPFPKGIVELGLKNLAVHN